MRSDGRATRGLDACAAGDPQSAEGLLGRTVAAPHALTPALVKGLAARRRRLEGIGRPKNLLRSKRYRDSAPLEFIATQGNA